MSASDAELEHNKQRALELLNSNRLNEARQCYRDITRQAPEDAAAWFMLGTTEGRLGNLAAAEAAMCKSLAADAQLAEAWLGLGQVLELQGRPDDACQTYLKALSYKPQLADAHAALGNIYNARGGYESAAEHLAQAVALGATRPQVMLALGDARRGSSRFREALNLYLQLLQQFPADAGLHARAAAMHYELTEIDQAQQHFQRALQLNPAFIEAQLGLINLHYQRRESAQALAAIRALFDKHKQHCGVVLLYTRLCHLDGSCRRVMKQAETLLGHPDISAGAQSQLCFELGRLYDADKKYERAFAYYRRANAFKRGQYDREAAQRSVAAILSRYTAAAMAKTGTLRRDRHRPLFVVGMPRSGTSLVEQILAAHPQVYGAGELTDLPALLRRYREAGAHDEAAAMSVDDMNAMAEHYLQRLDSVATGDERYVSDKMPSNFFRLGLVTKLFPDAKVIHVRRNPIDTCLSCYFQDFSGPHAYSYDLDDLVHYYKNYRRVMAHWREHLPRPMLEVDYETLVGDPETEVRRMLDFLELDWDDRCMRFYQTERAVITASHAQIQVPIYKGSVSRWRNYERFVTPLIKGFADDAGIQNDGQ